jgi:tetratricopeptide (TPR) repeat protein
MALPWALGDEDAEVGVRLTIALSRFWDYGYWNEARIWSQRALARSIGMALALRASVLRLHAWWGDEQAWAMYEEALALFRTTGDTLNIALTLKEQGELAREERDYPLSARLLEESLALYRDIGDQRGTAAALHALGDCARDHGNLTQAAALLEESVASYRA